MGCGACKFWLKDYSFPNSVGYCSLKGSVTSSSVSCELFRRKEEGSVAIQVISY